jgi:hypothetical protein
MIAILCRLLGHKTGRTIAIPSGYSDYLERLGTVTTEYFECSRCGNLVFRQLLWISPSPPEKQPKEET